MSIDFIFLCLTGIIVGIILCVMIYFYKKDKLETGTPAFLTTLGIFGTFSGMVLGLAPFLFSKATIGNPESLSTLVKGVTLACACSAIGIGLSLFSKHAQNNIARKKSTQTEHTGATADTLANLLGEILEQQKAQTISSSLLQKSIAGEEDGSLLTQLQKIRTQFTDKQDELINEFKGFSETMAKNNTEALIDALSSVIKDFNQKISDQFGENFKHLNEAVGRLLEWQISYKDEIHALTTQFGLCLNGIEGSKDALSSISEKSVSIVNAANTLEGLLVTYEDQKVKLSENLTAFASLSKEANQAFPIIHENIHKITTSFSTTAEEMAQSQKTMIETQGSFLSEVINSYDTIEKRITECSENVLMESKAHIQDIAASLHDTISVTTKNLSDSIEDTAKTQKSILNTQNDFLNEIIVSYESMDKKMTECSEQVLLSSQTYIKEMANNLNNTLGEISEKIRSQITALDQALEEELTKSLSSLGNQLSSLSSKFASDYKPLTEKLQKILQISAGDR